MLPAFYVAELTVENFRGIQHLTLKLSADQWTVLIGPNNAGKSTLLDAIGIAIGSAKFGKYSPEDDDFWTPGAGATADVFKIELSFKPRTGGSLPAVKGGLGDPIEVHGIRFTAERGGGYDRHLIGAKSEDILVNLGAPISKAKQAAYKGQGLTGRRYARVSDIQKWMPQVWHIDSKTLFPSLYEWKSGPLQQLLRLYKEDLLSAEWTTPSGHAMPHALEKAHHFVRDQALPTPYWRDELSKTMTEKFHAFTGRQSGFAIAPGLGSIEEWVLAEFQIMVAPGQKLAPVDARRLGDGWQNLLRLAAMEAVAELGPRDRTAIILAEEPETYLHPHLRRRLRRSFERLQKLGYQIVAASHAPELISFCDSHAVVRLQMTGSGAEARQYSTAIAGDALRQEEKLTERGNHEMVFANVAILTEGKADVYAIRLGLSKLAIDCDAESISVVDCGSVGNLPDYAAVCTALGIPWIAIHDEDIDASGAQKKNTADAVAKLQPLRTANDDIQAWQNELEDAIGFRAMHATGKVNPAWIDQTHGTRTWATIATDTTLKSYRDVMEAIKAKIDVLFAR